MSSRGFFPERSDIGRDVLVAQHRAMVVHGGAKPRRAVLLSFTDRHAFVRYPCDRQPHMVRLQRVVFADPD